MLIAASGAAGAQTVPTYQLRDADARFEESFSRVAGIRELPDGRVIVLDLADQGVVVLDQRLQRSQPVGRKGNGPNEYAVPTKLLAMPNGESAILDWGNTRLLKIGPNGVPAGFLPANSRCPTNPGQYPLYAGVDRDGRFYSEGPVSFAAQDSTAIIRWRSACAGDTLAFYRGPRPQPTRVAFRTFAQWAVSERGTIAIVRPEPYRISFISASGLRIDGRPVQYDPIRVTEAIKEQWRAEQQVPMGVMTVTRNGAVSGGVMKKPYQEPDSWPSVLPPFLNEAAMFDIEERLWVRRTIKPGDAPLYDVIDDEGRLTARIQLREQSRVAGFGNGTVYVVSRDDDDLEYVERYRLMRLR